MLQALPRSLPLQQRLERIQLTNKLTRLGELVLSNTSRCFGQIRYGVLCITEKGLDPLDVIPLPDGTQQISPCLVLPSNPLSLLEPAHLLLPLLLPNSGLLLGLLDQSAQSQVRRL